MSHLEHTTNNKLLLAATRPTFNLCVCVWCVETKCDSSTLALYNKNNNIPLLLSHTYTSLEV